MKRTKTSKIKRTKPVKWNDDRSRQAYKLASLLGATDEQMAEVMGVDINTIYYWKRTKPEFLEAVNAGKALPDDEVERSLFQRAIGYSHPAEDIKVCDGHIVKTPIMKHYPPDVTACIFWLKNRRREKWADVNKLLPSPVNLTQINLSGFSRKEKLLIEKLGLLEKYGDAEQLPPHD